MKNSNSLIALLITSGAQAVLGLLTAFGVPITVEQMTAIMIAVGFVGVVVTLFLWGRTVPKEEVVERLVGDAVIAGEANDVVPNGAEVRTIKS